MKIRIRATSSGRKGIDWTRIYKVEARSFIFWKHLKTYDTPKEAVDYVSEIAKFSEIIFIL